MRKYVALLLSLVALNIHAQQWVVEAEGDGKVEWTKEGVADIHAPGGLTLWNKQLLKGDVEIEFEARIVGDGRVSDLNCFWMASDPQAKDVFKNLKQRGGKFVNSYALQLYYVGYGGNHNSTTRFRRYDGDVRGVTKAEYRPAILREYLDKDHMIKADHWYKIRLEAKAGRVRYFIDGEKLVDFVDPKPLKKGYFGFRTTLAHAQLRNYKATCKDADETPIVVKNLFGDECKNGLFAQPTTFGIPFLQGELQANAQLTLSDDGGTELNSDQWTLATWPDGSVKWKAFATVAPKGNRQIMLKKSAGRSKIKTVENQQNMLLHTSVSPYLVDSITINGRKVMGRLWIELNDEMLAVRKKELEHKGKVRDTWRFDGDNFTLRLYTYKGSNEIKLVHTAFIDSLTNINGLGSLAIKAEVCMHDALHKRTVAFGTNTESGSSISKVMQMQVKPLIARRAINLDADGNPADVLSRNILDDIAAWDGFRLSQISPNAYSIRKRATSSSPWLGTIEGYKAPGTIAIGDMQSSVAFHLSDFWQSYPSTLQVDNARSDKAVVSLYLWSKEAERMCFEHYDIIAHGLNAAYEDVQPGMSTAYGIARTSVVYIYPTLNAVQESSVQLASIESHAQYVASSEYLHDKRAFGYWSLSRGTQLDKELDRLMKFYANEQKKHGWYGYFNYGDFMHSYDASRDEWRYDVGGYAWANTELGPPAMLWYQFLRTGDKSVWRMAEAMTRHCSEVDCYHSGPHAGLGTRHNVLHWGCGAKEARISQAFWNRFYYYLTADERTGDLLHDVVDADKLLYTLDPMRLAQPRSDKYPCTAPARLRVGPDWLAYAGNWFTEWERTGNSYYRDKILTGMKSISALPHGMFSGPKALGYDPATGVVSWEGDAEMQNTNHLLTIMGGFEMMNEMMISVSTPEWDHTWLDHAANYKQKALTISRNKFRIPRLQGYAYWLTGKREYVESALNDLVSPFRMLDGAESQNTASMTSKGGFFTNDAATFTLDAIFLQEVME